MVCHHCDSIGKSTSYLTCIWCKGDQHTNPKASW